MNIDIHNHCVPERFLRELRAAGSIHGLRYSKDSSGREWIEFMSGATIPVRRSTCDAEARLQDMDQADIDLAVLSFSPGAFSESMDPSVAIRACEIANDAMAELVQSHRRRFLAMATVPLQAPKEAAKELERCAGDLSMPAVQIPSIVDGTNLDDPSLLPFFESAEDLDILVFVHPTHPLAEPELRRYYLKNLIGNPLDTTIAVASIIFGGILDRFPHLKLCFAHGGGTAPYLRGRWEHGYLVRQETKVSVKRPFSEYFGLLYFDSLTHFAPALNYLIHSVGSERVLIGTDYPADMGNMNQVAAIRSLDSISEADKSRILGENAAGLLKIRQRVA